jgi:Holliday junction resolvase-like predicted endonuclease
MNTVKVLGYSERGIINSIVFYLREHPELMGEFLKVLGIELSNDFRENVEYTLLGEQSFSEFGTCDLVIIAKNKDNKKIVVFVEGKVKTERGKFTLDKNFDKLIQRIPFKKISSNIFVQLYHKYLLSQLTDKKTGMHSEIVKKTIKLGNNKIVNRAYNDYVANAEHYFFVAILPINIDSKELQDKFEGLQLTPPIMPTKNIRCVYWDNIEKLFSNNSVAENFLYNRGQIY